MKRRKVALITCRDIPNLTEDDQRLIPPLEGYGLEVHIKSWDSESADWWKYDYCVLRSCWDYHLRFDRFRRWLRSLTEKRINLWNPIPIVLWNLHKGYLKELEKKGVPIVATCWVKKHSTPDLRAILQARQWEEVVIKPAIAASAYRTFRVRTAEADLYKPDFAEVLRDSDALIQPFLPEIRIHGEWSFIFLGEEFSHAVLRRPRENDFRTQPEYGGILMSEPPRKSWITEARRVVRSAPSPTLYARVDAVPVDGHLRVLELELIEPCLFFVSDPQAPLRFARTLAALAETRAERQKPKSAEGT